MNEVKIECHLPILEHNDDPIKDVQTLYHKMEGKSTLEANYNTSSGQVSMHFNSFDSIFANQYLHKYQYGGKGLGKSEQGIIEHILARGQHKQTCRIRIDTSTSSIPPSTIEVQNNHRNNQNYTRDLFDEWFHCTMMHVPMYELEAYYIDLFLPPPDLVRVDIF